MRVTKFSPHLWPLEHFLTFWHCMLLQIHLVFPLLQAGISYFSKDSCFSFLGMLFRNQHLGARYAPSFDKLSVKEHNIVLWLSPHLFTPDLTPEQYAASHLSNTVHSLTHSLIHSETFMELLPHVRYSCT